MGNSIYTSITQETVQGARDRALAALEELTGGRSEEAVALVSEFVELNNILEEQKKYAAYKETQDTESTC